MCHLLSLKGISVLLPPINAITLFTEENLTLLLPRDMWEGGL